MLDKAATLKEAQKYLAKGAVDKAISELEKLVKESPDGNTFNMIGDIYLRKGAQKAAIEHYQKAAFFFRSEGFSQKAQALYKKVLNINPSDTEALLAFGEICEEKGMVAEAIKYYLVVADLYAKEGKKEKILEVYTKVLAVSPANIPLRVKVADIYIKEGLKAEAAREFVHIAHIHEEKGELPKAKEFFQKTLELQPLNRDAALGLSHLLQRNGETKLAFDQIKNALALFPEDIDILARCADLALTSGDAGLAEKCLQKILAKDAANMRARRMLGELYLKAGKTEVAWSCYLPILDDILPAQATEDAIAFLDTFRPVDPLTVGRKLIPLCREAGDDDRAVSELLALGDHYAAEGQEEEARTCYAEAEQINPHHEEVLRRVTPPAPEPQEPELPAPEERLEAETLTAGFDLADQVPLTAEEPGYEPGPEEMQPSPASEEMQIERFDRFEEPQKDEQEGINIRAEKSYDEVITEADIFARYGLLSEAQKLLENLKERFPDNVDVHQRLKTAYTDTHNKEAAVTECLLLAELYRSQGNEAAAAEALKEAIGINPGDHRLSEPRPAATFEPAGFTMPEPSFTAPAPEGEPDIEDYEEEIAEVDFYTRQGLNTEAIKILEKLQRLFPENREVKERLQALGQLSSGMESAEAASPIDMHDVFELHEPAGQPEGIAQPDIFEHKESPGLPEDFLQHDRFELPEMPEEPQTFELDSSLGGLEENRPFAPPQDEGFEMPEPADPRTDFAAKDIFGSASPEEETQDTILPDMTFDLSEPAGLPQDFEFESGALNEGMQDSMPLEDERLEMPEPSAPQTDFAMDEIAGAAPAREEAGDEPPPDISFSMTGPAGMPTEFEPSGFSETAPESAGLTDTAPEAAGADFPGIDEPVRTPDQLAAEREAAEEAYASGSGMPPEAAVPGESEFEAFSLTDGDLTESSEMPEPPLDSDVLEIFQEFKKGIEKELGEEDSETHYNLGIAYREMGLVDDAIKEFQSSRNDPARFIQSSTMLGGCYMEKGLSALAVDVIKQALEKIKDRDDSYWALTYELAEAHEKSGNLKEALELYTGVYGWNAKFREVSDKMSQLRVYTPVVAEKTKEQEQEKPKERKSRVSYL